MGKHNPAFMYSIHFQTLKLLVKAVCQLCFVVKVVSYSTHEKLLVCYKLYIGGQDLSFLKLTWEAWLDTGLAACRLVC